MSQTILVVEDERAIREMVATALGRAGFEVLSARNATEAEALLATGSADLALLDWMLPGISGIELVRRLRRHAALRDLPVIMLTARGEESDRLKGFTAGVDDYISKPFSVRELVARIQAVLRRSEPGDSASGYQAGGLRLDPDSHRVTVRGRTVSVGPTEFRLLRFFMEHPDRAYTRDQLLDGVWGRDAYVGDRTVDVYVRRLRKALAPHGCDGLIQTVHGTGYRFSV